MNQPIESALDATFGFSDADLVDVDREILAAIESRSTDGLRVLGFGENDVALAFPTDAPKAVIKRSMGCRTEAAANLRLSYIADYVRSVEPFITVAPTELRAIKSSNGRIVPFMIQHPYPKEQLVETILRATEPSASNEIVLALRDAILATCASGKQALDAQFSNFAWVDGHLEYFDVGLPFVYEDGEYTLDFDEALLVMPAFLRRVADKTVRETLVEMGGVRGGFTQAAMGLVRMDLDEWLEPVLEAFNEVLEEPLVAAEMRERSAELNKRTGVLKRFMRLQRSWTTRVRKQPYDCFITDSFTGKLL